MLPKIIIKNKITIDQFNQIDALWNEEFPQNLNNRFGKLLDGINTYKHHLLLNDSNEIIGWSVAFLRDGEFWFSILIPSKHQGKGYGQMLINSLKEKYKKLNGWVIDHNNDFKTNGDTYRSPIQFYLKNDFKIIAEKRIDTEMISAVKICWM